MEESAEEGTGGEERGWARDGRGQGSSGHERETGEEEDEEGCYGKGRADRRKRTATGGAASDVCRQIVLIQVVWVLYIRNLIVK